SEIDLEVVAAAAPIVAFDYRETRNLLDSLKLELCEVLTLGHRFQQEVAVLICPSTFHKRSATLLVPIWQENRKRLPRDLLFADPYLSSKAVNRLKSVC